MIYAMKVNCQLPIFDWMNWENEIDITYFTRKYWNKDENVNFETISMICTMSKL